MDKYNELIAKENFFNTCRSAFTAPIPSFVKIKNNCLFLTEFNISDSMAKALRDFLTEAAELPQYQVHKLIFDNCRMTDAQFSCILQGIVS